MGIVALVAFARPMTPPRKTRVVGRVRGPFAFAPTLRADSSGPLFIEELVTYLVTALSFDLCIDHATQKLVAPIGVIRGQPVVLVDVMPDGRMGVHLIVKRAEEHILFRCVLHA